MIRLILMLIAIAGPAFAQHGIYAEQTTYTTAESPVVYVSTNSGSAFNILILNSANSTIRTDSVTEPAQTDSATPWLDAEWSRSRTLSPIGDTGLYQITIDPTTLLDAATIAATATNGTTNLLWKEVIYVLPVGAPSADDVLIIGSSLTDTAYQKYGGKSLYDNPYASQVGLYRPGVDSNFVARALQACIIVLAASKTCLYADDLYIQDNPSYLNNFTMVILNGLHEYGTYRLRQAYKAYVNQGGRMLITGGEALIRQLRDEPGGLYTGHRAPEWSADPIVSDGIASNDHLAAYHVVSPFINDPEAGVVGSSLWMGMNPTAVSGTGDNWTLYRTGHWLFTGGGYSDGDGLKTGNLLDANDFVDGLKLKMQGGLPYVIDHDQYGVPHETMILGTIETSNAIPTDCGTGTYQSDFESDVSCEVSGHGVISITTYGGNGGAVLHIPEVGIMAHSSPGTPLRQVLVNAVTKMANPAAFDPFDGFPLRARGVGVIGSGN